MRRRVWGSPWMATPLAARPVGDARLAAPRRLQPAPDVAFLGVLEPDWGDGVAPDRENGRDGAYPPHHGQQGRVGADSGVPLWLAIILNGAPVSGARLGRGPLSQTVR